MEEIDRLFLQEKVELKKRITNQCTNVIQAEVKVAEATINSEQIKSEQDLQTAIEEVRTKFEAKLTHVEMNQKNQIVNQHVLQLTIKGLKTLLWRQRSQY